MQIYSAFEVKRPSCQWFNIKIFLESQLTVYNFVGSGGQAQVYTWFFLFRQPQYTIWLWLKLHEKIYFAACLFSSAYLSFLRDCLMLNSATKFSSRKLPPLRLRAEESFDYILEMTLEVFLQPELSDSHCGLNSFPAIASLTKKMPSSPSE